MYSMHFITFLALITRFTSILCFCEEESKEKLLTISSNSSYPGKDFMYNGTISDCECKKNTCIRKCCDVNYQYTNKTCVYAGKETLFSIFDGDHKVTDNLTVKVISGYVNCESGNAYLLEPSEEPDDQFFLQRDGRLWHPSESETISLKDYCIDDIDGELSALVCFPKKSANTTINIAGMVISMPFLLATFLIYALLPNLNIHGKSLMCYVFSLLMAYISLSIVNSTVVRGVPCIATAMFCLYFFVASFFWMNVMSIDIWKTFSGKRESLGNTKETARKQFLIYNSYAWGVPLVLVIIVGLLNHYTDEKAWYNPNIGASACWFGNSISDFLYFYAPLALIIILNLSLFAVTAVRIRKLQKDTEILRSGKYKKHSEEQKRFKLYIRLSLAMGINWIMEIISWGVNWKIGSVPPSVWYLTDFCNAAYGVVIFFIFVFKKKIWKMLRQRYPCGTQQVKDETNLSNV